MALSATSRARFNLSDAQVLLLDETSLGMQVLVQILVGFGARALFRAHSLPEAREFLDHHSFDLMVVDTLHDGKGYDFVQWLRRSGLQPNCFAPVLMTAAHTPEGDVARARDCGANFILAKPLTPLAVLERILWIGREARQFVECDSYLGPDRRFRDEPGHPARRRADRQPDPPAAADPAGGADLKVNP
jgi:DNA-binding response OmpR family regulator